jgi:hypothetical protein
MAQLLDLMYFSQVITRRKINDVDGLFVDYFSRSSVGFGNLWDVYYLDILCDQVCFDVFCWYNKWDAFQD